MHETTNPVAEVIFDQDLEQAINLVGKEMPEPLNPDITVTTDVNRIKKFLRMLLKKKPAITLDFETTGLKPQAKGHKILSCSITYKRNQAFAFPILDEIKPLLRKVLEDRQIKKTAAGVKFEKRWATLLDCRIKGWKADVMIDGHIRENRRGTSSVKFQGYVHFGIVDYDSHISQYKKSKRPKGQKKISGNDFNTMHKLKLHDLLYYNGMDTVIEHELELLPTPKEPAWLFRAGSLAFGDMEQNGIRIDVPYYDDQLKKLDRRREKRLAKMTDLKEVKLWKKKFGKKFNIASDEQLAEILYEDLGYEVPHDTDKENSSVDKEALLALGTKFTKGIMKLREIKTTDNKIHEFLRESIDGIIHPDYNLNFAKSFRSQCQSPQFHNVSVRNAVMSKIIRGGVIPRAGNQLLEIDYRGIEVRVSACLHQDPAMLAYIKDPSKDMHRDMAMECYLLKMKQVTKDSRYCAKNQFVFPEFYGDYYVDCAKNLWNSITSLKLETEDGTPMKEHLIDQGIETQRERNTHRERLKL